MKKGSRIIVITALLFSSPAEATITVISHQFSAVSDGTIDTTGALDWGFVGVPGGFFDSDLNGGGESHLETDFADFDRNDGTILTTVSPDSLIGPVTLTEGTNGSDTVIPQNNVSNYTFDGVTAHGSYGNFAPSEQDVWQMTFNDLGVGQFEIKLYMGHSTPNRSFDMDVAGSGITPLTTTTEGPISNLESSVAAYGANGSAFTYDINISTTNASDDLTLTFGGTGGGFGGAILAGYTVTSENATPSGTPAITAINYDPGTGTLDLTWDSLEGRSYLIRYSSDLVDWTETLGTAGPSDVGPSTSRSFDLTTEIPEAGDQLFFRVDLVKE